MNEALITETNTEEFKVVYTLQNLTRENKWWSLFSNKDLQLVKDHYYVQKEQRPEGSFRIVESTKHTITTWNLVDIE